MDLGNTVYYGTKVLMFLNTINKPVETGLILLLGITSVIFIAQATKKA